MVMTRAEMVGSILHRPCLWGSNPTLTDHLSWDTVWVDGECRCSPMVEFPVRTTAIWFPFGDIEDDFVFPTRGRKPRPLAISRRL